jgi:hypothetical protein
LRVDDAIEEALLDVVGRLEAARYAVDRAFRQFFY